MKSTAIVKRVVDDLVNQLSKKIYDRSAKKFIREFLIAITISQSTVMTKIVRSLTKITNSLMLCING